MTYEDDDDDTLGVDQLVSMFEAAEESSQDARLRSERDRDYYDGKQLTAEEQAELARRGQPEVVINRIKRKIDYLVGLEKQQRTMPKGMPRTPLHQQDAEAVTDSLRYVADDQKYHVVRSAVWRNLLVEGAGAVCVDVKPGKPEKLPQPQMGAGMGAMMAGMGQPVPPGMVPQIQQQPQLGGSYGAPLSGGGTFQMKAAGKTWDVTLRQYAWDRFFFDPHSSRLDFSDATYLGTVLWMDLKDARLRWPDEKEALEGCFEGSYSQTYDDTPHTIKWADTKRRRIRIVQIWIKKGEDWHFAEFCRGGILKAGPSPYKTDSGDSDCPVIAASAYCDRENNRYGVVREMISPQDEVNKRRSKALHLLNTSQMIYEEGAFHDEEDARRQGARPDGMVKVNPGYFDKFRFETRDDMAAGQAQLLQEAKGEMDLMGPNASMQGDQGGEASGRAIIASQQGGMIELGDLLDTLREFDKRVFAAIWHRIRQYWTAPKWIRVTDDERNIRFAPINGAIDQQTGRVGPTIAELEVDVHIDDAPDSVVPQLEQWQSLVELKKVDVNNELPFKWLVEAMPNLRNKEVMLEKLDQQQQAAAQQPNPEMAAMQAKLQMEQQSGAMKMQMDQQKNAAELQMKQAELELEHQKVAGLLAAKQKEIELRQQEAEANALIEHAKAQHDAQLKQQAAAQDAQLKRETAQQQMELDFHKTNQDLQLAKTKADSDMAIRKQTADHQQELAWKTATDKAAAKPGGEKTSALTGEKKPAASTAQPAAPAQPSTRTVKFHHDPKTGRISGATITG